jgi:hypothetical protein
LITDGHWWRAVAAFAGPSRTSLRRLSTAVHWVTALHAFIHHVEAQRGKPPSPQAAAANPGATSGAIAAFATAGG